MEPDELHRVVMREGDPLRLFVPFGAPLKVVRRLQLPQEEKLPERPEVRL